MKATVKILIILLIVSFTLGGRSKAQRIHLPNNPNYDLKKYHFGFMLGLNQMNFSIKTSDQLKDTLYGIESRAEFGFNVGIVSDLRINNFMNLRFVPSLAFGERTMNYFIKYSDGTVVSTLKKVESTYLQFPVELKIRSERMTNFRAYILTGLNFCVDMASQAKKKQEDEDYIVKLNKTDLLYEFGVGFDFYLVYFKMATELKMCYGLKDLLVRESNLYTDNIERLNSKIFQFSITF